ncbi:hypothetical protein [Microbacterium sp. SLBN-111]|uniref:hypothetical protein n=1 Tax=Microbacterium sp. SLBN-111 TaxID=3377733 RepID=UPI003C755827
MSTITRRVPNSAVTPLVRADVFADHPTSRFAVRALGRGLHADPFGVAALELRTRVYTEQTHMLDENDLIGGLDIDDDDDRSYGFLAMENRPDGPRAVGYTRVIERLGRDRRPLPADALYDLDLDGEGVEVSRYISRVGDADGQAQVLREILRPTIAHIRQRGMDDHVYAIVEPPLARVLRMMGVGVTEVSEPRRIEEYRGVNLAIRLDPIVSAAHLGGLAEIDGLDVSEGAMHFWGEVGA